MKKILLFSLFFVVVSCAKHLPEPDPPEPPLPPTPDENVLSYMFDAKDQYIGAVLEVNETYYKVRSSKGYWAVIADYLSMPCKGIYFSTQNNVDTDTRNLYNPQKKTDPFDPELVRISNDIDHPDRFYTRTKIDGDSASKNESSTVRYFFGTQGKSEESTKLGFYIDQPTRSHVDKNTWDTLFMGSDLVTGLVTNPIKIYSTTDADEAFQKTGFPKSIDESGSPQLLSFDEASIKDGFPESERYWQGWD